METERHKGKKKKQKTPVGISVEKPGGIWYICPLQFLSIQEKILTFVACLFVAC